MPRITHRVDPAIKEFDAPRIYTDTELRDFHQKIQKFWDEPREVNGEAFGKRINGVARRFRHYDLHVAYGAAKKVRHGQHDVYLYIPDRYHQFENLWQQYEDWRKKQEWIENKNLEALDNIAEEIPF